MNKQYQAATNKPSKILRLPDVVSRVGLSKAMIYRLQRQGKFPQGVRLSERTTGWHEADVETWIEARGKTGGAA